MVKARSTLHSLFLFIKLDVPLSLRVLAETIWLVRREGINVICIGELDSMSWLGIFCKKWLHCKLIYYIHGEEITTVTPFRRFGKRRKKYLAHADAVIAVSAFTRKALMDLMAVQEEKIALIPNGVDALRFTPAPKSEPLLQRYALQNKRVLLTVGRLVERKGIDMMLRALPKIIAVCPDAHYLIVGEGEYKPQLESVVATLKLYEQVTFAGRILEEELVDHYNLCDLFVMPNRQLANQDTEGFGLVFLEANACEKAVIGGRAGGVVEAVRDGITGLLVDGRNVQQIADAVIRLLTDQPFRQRLERAGIQHARASSSAERAQQFYRLCERLLGFESEPMSANMGNIAANSGFNPSQGQDCGVSIKDIHNGEDDRER